MKDWVAAINNAGLRPSDGWCYSHRFGSFAPQRGLIDDGSQAQWFIDGKEAFEAIAASIEAAKSEVWFLLLSKHYAFEDRMYANLLMLVICRYLSQDGGFAQNYI